MKTHKCTLSTSPPPPYMHRHTNKFPCRYLSFCSFIFSRHRSFDGLIFALPLRARGCSREKRKSMLMRGTIEPPGEAQ